MSETLSGIITATRAKATGFSRNLTKNEIKSMLCNGSNSGNMMPKLSSLRTEAEYRRSHMDTCRECKEVGTLPCQHCPLAGYKSS
jgi:hypothetical protein